MTRKNILAVLLVSCAVLICTPTIVYAHAGHDHSKGGGCTECTPPTLGLDEEGKRLISGGIVINGQSHDVDFFKQNLNAEILNVNEPVEIILKVYENTGIDSIEHVELNIGQEDRFVSGVTIPHNPVTIEWNKTFDGKETVTIHDKQNLVKDVSVHVIDTSPIIGFKFKFTPVEEFNANTLVTKIWDTRKNVSVNHFYDALNIASSEKQEIVHTTDNKLIKSDTVKQEKSNHMINEINNQIQCYVGQERLLRASNLSPICVDAYQASVLLAYGWAIPIQ